MDEERRTISLRGELDLSTISEASACLEDDTPPRQTILDLSGVTFIDTSGMRFLIEAQQSAEAQGSSLLVRNPSARVRVMLRVSGLLPYLRISTE